MNFPYTEQAERQMRQARKIIKEGRFIETWQNSGAVINLVGSLAIGVLAKHLDIDFHIYTNELNLQQSFDIIGQICDNQRILKCEFSNLAATEEQCLEWHLSYNDDQNKLWQIDMIQIRRGSKYDGYFENVARQITDAMTAPQRETILKLKFETPDNLKISGIEYYKAVIQNDISDIDTFLNWRQKQNFAGIIEW